MRYGVRHGYRNQSGAEPRALQNCGQNILNADPISVGEYVASAYGARWTKTLICGANLSSSDHQNKAKMPDRITGPKSGKPTCHHDQFQSSRFIHLPKQSAPETL